MNNAPPNESHAHPPPELILASSSPRRAELLRQHGYRFRVVSPDLPEPASPPSAAEPWQLAEALAYFKARQVAWRTRGGVILAADTVVAIGGEVFGKPTDREEARRILETLTHNPHEVITGVATIDDPGKRRLICHERTKVYMRPMSSAEMTAYLDSGDWKGKAGAYGVQDAADAFVERLEGSFTNVVGLPMELLTRMLAELGVVATPTDAPQADG